MTSQEITKEAGEIEREAEQHSAATAEGGAKEINRVWEDSELKPSVMNTTTEVVEPGGGTVEMTHAYGSKDRDRFLFVAKPFLASIKHADDDPSQVKGEVVG